MSVIILEDWMIEGLKLGGLELLAFALIHGCTQKGDGCWHGGYENMSKRIGGSPRATIDAVNKLMEHGLVKKGEGVINGRKKNIFTSNPPYAETSYEETSHEETSPRPMQFLHPNKENNIYNIYQSDTPAREGEQDKPRENWRFLSSLRKFSLGNDPDKIAEYKRKLISEELQEIAASLNMPKEAQEKFLSKWCEHNPKSEKIKADYEPTFNVRDRAEQFMGWWGKNGNTRQDDKNDKLNPNAKWGR